MIFNRKVFLSIHRKISKCKHWLLNKHKEQQKHKFAYTTNILWHVNWNIPQNLWHARWNIPQEPVVKQSKRKKWICIPFWGINGLLFWNENIKLFINLQKMLSGSFICLPEKVWTYLASFNVIYKKIKAVIVSGCITFYAQLSKIPWILENATTTQRRIIYETFLCNRWSENLHHDTKCQELEALFLPPQPFYCQLSDQNFEHIGH